MSVDVADCLDARPGVPLRRRFVDVEEQAAALDGWNQDYVQLSGGRYQGELWQMRAPGVRLFVERVEGGILQTGALPPDVLGLGLALHSDGQGMFCGQPCVAGMVHVFSGAQGFEFRTPSRHTMLGVELRLESGLQGTQGLGGLQHRPDGAALTAGVLTHAPQQRAIGARLRAFFQAARARQALLHEPRALATLADELLELTSQSPAAFAHSSSHGLLHVPAHHALSPAMAHELDHAMAHRLDHAKAHGVHGAHSTHGAHDAHRAHNLHHGAHAHDAATTSPRHAQALVQRCRDWLHQQPSDQLLSVARLGEAMQVSRRTLQNGFRQQLNLTPLAYIKALRLRNVRRALKQGQAVSDAAAANGFWHFGHFAHDYALHFGERPSETLRRYHAH